MTFTNVAEGSTPCQDVTVAAGATFTAGERRGRRTARPWNGSAEGYPNVSDDGGTHDHFTIHNKELDRVRTITLCKAINFVDDGIDEGGQFTFDVTWNGGSRSRDTDLHRGRGYHVRRRH